MKLLLILSLTLFTLLSAGAKAASFDCARASTPDERAVCSDQRLSELDSITGEAYSRARQVSGPAEITPIARDFMADRRACGANPACIMASYMAAIRLFQNSGSKIEIPVWANAAAMAGGDAPELPAVPKLPGQCVHTVVRQVMPRLDPGHRVASGDFDSGTAISFANRGYQVSYEREEPLLHSQPGDGVIMCLISIPHHCPPGDMRGRVYDVTNLRTRESWSLPDAEHGCGGA